MFLLKSKLDAIKFVQTINEYAQKPKSEIYLRSLPYLLVKNLEDRLSRRIL
jgi:hypothetical protein